MSNLGEKYWRILIQRSDEAVSIQVLVPNDELEYGVDDALAKAREVEAAL